MNILMFWLFSFLNQDTNRSSWAKLENQNWCIEVKIWYEQSLFVLTISIFKMTSLIFLATSCQWSWTGMTGVKRITFEALNSWMNHSIDSSSVISEPIRWVLQLEISYFETKNESVAVWLDCWKSGLRCNVAEPKKFTPKYKQAFERESRSCINTNELTIKLMARKLRYFDCYYLFQLSTNLNSWQLQTANLVISTIKITKCSFVSINKI